jgi:hypothetical protein
LDSPAVSIAADRGASPSDLAGRLAAKLPGNGLAAILVFVSTHYDAAEFAEAMARHYPDTPVYGCTTAGELAPSGLEDDSAVALGFRKSDFSVVARPIFDLAHFHSNDGRALAREMRDEIAAADGEISTNQLFGLLLVDGLSRREEAVIASISAALDNIPVVGGSAGDQLRFEKTWIICGGKAHQDAAVLLLVSTALPFLAFKCDQFETTKVKLVVTEADLDQRCAKELNAEPASQQYAQSIGARTESLDIDAFALNPLVVNVGSDHYARSIRKADADGSLHFFSAIDEGLVLTGARRGDSLANLRDLFEKTEAELGEVSLYLGFDCILRRIDAERHQKTRDLSDLFRDHHVVGFNTYGEQFRSMHLNETFTGIAIGRRRVSI